MTSNLSSISPSLSQSLSHLLCPIETDSYSSSPSDTNVFPYPQSPSGTMHINIQEKGQVCVETLAYIASWINYKDGILILF